jgi:hypothetical protein
MFGATTRVLQRVGRIEFQVEKRDVRYFSVETPSLVAAVKGTRFTVVVGAGRSDVGVSGGLVGVTDLATGQSADVAAGQRASTRGHGLNVSGRGTKPAITLGQSRPRRVPAMTAQAVSAEVRSVTARAPAAQAASRGRGHAGARSDEGASTSNAPGRSGGHGGRGGGNGRGHGNGGGGHGNGNGNGGGRGGDH